MAADIAFLIAEARRLEALAMTVYVRFGHRFSDNPEIHAFWMSMARHEAAHVGALELLDSMRCESELDLEISISAEGVEAAAVQIERIAEEAKKVVTLDRAFELAIELEGGELEDLVLDLIHGLADEAERDQAAMMLVHDLSDLSLMIEKHASDDELLARADDLVESHVDRRMRRFS